MRPTPVRALPAVRGVEAWCCASCAACAALVALVGRSASGGDAPLAPLLPAVYSTGALPSGFTMKLRKHVRNRRLSDIVQLGTDRVVAFVFGSGEGR